MSLPGALIVSTGRCGSTLLSNLFREHEDVLSLSEFWPNRPNLPALFGTDPVSGQDYWDRLSVPMAGDIFKIALGGKISQVPKHTLHETNYMRRIALPSILEDYDSLFDRIAAYMCARPVATPAEHVREMYSFIATDQGKKVWVERTGASIEYLPLWQTMWPDSRMIHMYRDGRNVAQSMSKHHAFRLMVMRAEANPESSWLNIRPLDPETLDLDAFFARRIPLSEFGKLWNRMIENGLEDLRAFPPGNIHTMRYEDLLEDPVGELQRALAFFAPGLPSREWAERCAASLNAPRNDWRTLDPKVLQELEEVCASGLEKLGYQKVLVS